MQLMSREDDSTPIILDVDMSVVSVKWNDNGSMLAVAGFQGQQDKRHNFIHFYSPWGEVRTSNNTKTIENAEVRRLAFEVTESHGQKYRRLCVGSPFSPFGHRDR